MLINKLRREINKKHKSGVIMIKSGKKINPKHIQFVILVVLLVIIGFIKWYENYSNSTVNLLFFCWLNNIAFLSQIGLNKKMLGNYINPVTLFTIFLFLFSSGQLVLYSLGIEIGDFNIFQRLNEKTLTESIIYIILGFSFYQTGVFCSIKNNSIDYVKRIEKSKSSEKVSYVGWLLFALGLIPYLIFLIYNYSVVANSGYSAYYQAETERLSNGLVGIGYYLFSGLIFIVIGGNKNQKRFGIIFLVMIATIRLLSGDRGDGIVFILTAFMLYIFFLKEGKISKWFTFLLIIALMSLVPTIGVLRNDNGQTFLNVLAENNIVTSTLTNLGGTLWPLGKIIEIFPDQNSFTMGGSYLTSIFYLVPSFLRIGPIASLTANSLYSSPGNWLMTYLGMSYGPGFTPFAESFMNFGWGGLLIMSFFGFFFGKLLVPKTKNGKVSTFQVGISILTFQLFAMTARGSFNTVLSFYFRYVLIPILLYLLVKKLFNNSNFKINNY